MNLNLLSSFSKFQVENRPTLTLLRSSSDEAEKKYSESPVMISSFSLDLPNEFNGKEIWRDYLAPVKDQGKCGSCWAFASTTCLSDRFNIHTKGKVKVDLSAAGMLLCDLLGKEKEISDFRPEHDIQLVNSINAEALSKAGCYGNTLIDAWRYLYVIGAVELTCVPNDLQETSSYSRYRSTDIVSINDIITPISGVVNPNVSPNVSSEVDYNYYPPLSDYTSNDKIPLCSEIMGLFGDMCINRHWDPRTGNLMGTPARFWRSNDYYLIPGTPNQGGSEEKIRSDIYRLGPVTGGFKVYQDFYNFDPKKEIYEWNGVGPQVGGHAIEIVGWGEEKGKKYWWIRNSWGKKWGIDGYFKMIRGINNCELEENVMAGIPDLFYPIGYVNPTFSEEDRDMSFIPEEIRNERLDRDTGFNIESGGVEPSLGYTRRTLVRFPGFDFSSPVTDSDIPNYMIFIAGQIEGKSIKSIIALRNIILIGIIFVVILFILKWTKDSF